MSPRRLCWLLPLLLILACNLPTAAYTPSAPFQTSTPEPTAAPRSGFMEPTLAVVVELPAIPIEIEGAAYIAYRAAGDPFRFVCPSPCTGLSQFMYWQYAGFQAAHERLVQIMGVDALAELQPVDIHVMEDSKCGTRAAAPEPAFADYNARGNAYVCSFVFKDLNSAAITPEAARDASRLDHQADLVHAYAHTIFFGRVPKDAGLMHDFVTPIAMYVTNTLPGGDLCTYRPTIPPGDYGGRLIFNLCEDDRFEIEAMAPTMRAVDRLYRRDDGRVDERLEHLVPDMAQFRWELHTVLGRDVAGAFADACWPAELFEDTYELDSKCFP
jgi:hypothetical protein